MLFLRVQSRLISHSPSSRSCRRATLELSILSCTRVFVTIGAENCRFPPTHFSSVPLCWRGIFLFEGSFKFGVAPSCHQIMLKIRLSRAWRLSRFDNFAEFAGILIAYLSWRVAKRLHLVANWCLLILQEAISA